MVAFFNGFFSKSRLSIIIEMHEMVVNIEHDVEILKENSFSSRSVSISWHFLLL